MTTMCIGLGMGATVIWENPHHAGYGRALEENTAEDTADAAEPTATTTETGAAA
jgi:acetyl-CoA acyltransferase